MRVGGWWGEESFVGLFLGSRVGLKEIGRSGLSSCL